MIKMDNKENDLVLKLQNFRCHENRKMNVPDTGIVLLNAASGVGKTSLLHSLYYCITGAKIKNISTFGKKSTTVEVVIDNLKIVRTKNPNKLFVFKGDKIYEDKEGQVIIDEKFGKEFETVSYIDQCDKNSFIFLSPADKMEFLENLLLKEYDIDSIKDRLTKEISKTKEECVNESSKISTIKDIMKTMAKAEQNELDIGKIAINSKNFQKIHEKITNNLEVSKKNLKISTTKVRKLEEDLVVFIKSKERIKTIETILEDLKSQKKSIGFNDVDQGLKKIKYLNQIKINYKKYEDYEEKTQKLEEQRKKLEENTIKTKKNIDLLNIELTQIDPSIQKKLVDLKKTLDSYNNMEKIEGRLKELGDEVTEEFLEELKNSILKQKEEMTTIKQELDTAEQALKCYKCPKCESSLKLENDCLIMSGLSLTTKEHVLEISNRLKTQKRECDKLEKKYIESQKAFSLQEELNKEYYIHYDYIESIGYLDINRENVLRELKKCEEQLKRESELKQSIKNLENDSLNKQYLKDIGILEAIVSSFNLSLDEKVSKEDYLKAVEEYAIVKESLTRLENILKNIAKHSKDLEDLQNVKIEDKDYNSLIEAEKVKIVTYTSKVGEYEENIVNLNRWKTVNDNNDRYNTFICDIDLSNIRYQKMDERLKALWKLRDHIKNAERKAVLDFVDSLNIQANLYIEEFFPDQDIIVNLKTTMETKAGKEKIALNFEVEYRGTVGDLSFLSGGERDRVNLAYTLALSELVNSRLLLIDEATSSLDQETMNNVVETMKEKYKGKLILCICHNAELGMFDYVYNV